ncbi:hypothetical protein PINS_up022014 [Pythium insidiosum]|nr:hypothetical protein PINS_up022014 [Pythium insidiosum]
MPRDPVKAKGLLLASIRDPNPVVFLEPKALYRASVADVPVGEFTEELGKADIVKRGSDVTVVGWGAQMRVLEEACSYAEELVSAASSSTCRPSCPWDVDTIEHSVRKDRSADREPRGTQDGRFRAEIAATIQDRCFLSLEARSSGCAGYDTPFHSCLRSITFADALKNFEAIKKVMDF